MKNTSGSLEQQIEVAVERLVREHLAALEAAASAAVRATRASAFWPDVRRVGTRPPLAASSEGAACRR
jgi:hypothetical protein